MSGSTWQGRPGLSWTCVAMWLPDDGTGALPLLRQIILYDEGRSHGTQSGDR
jgi:hypothetical protein